MTDQREDYLVKALRSYKDNSSHGCDATNPSYDALRGDQP